MASIRFDAVRKTYDDQEILHGLSLAIADGEFIALVGPSGCGKSTLLRMVAGLEDVSGGEILLGDELINDVSPKDRNVAMVFQNYALYPHMSVAQNLGFALKLQREDAREIARRVREVAGILGLESLLERRPSQLSGGQRQRVAMGRAIIRQPQAFLFDEPLSNLDAKLRVQMRTEIKALHQRLRTTTLYVTHDQIEAMTMADRIVVMRDGHIEQVGTPLELYTNPANAFVAQFIGSPSMNLISGRVDRSRAGAHLVTDDGIALTVPIPPPVAQGQAVLLGVRPEHLTVTAPGANASFAAQILVVEPTGAETQIVAELGERRLTCIARGHFAQAPGTPLSLGIPPEHVYLFDAATGVRLAA